MTEHTDALIDAFCKKWKAETDRIDRLLGEGKWKIAFVLADEFAGWLEGFADACRVLGDSDCIDLSQCAAYLFIYRRYIVDHRRAA